MNVEEPITSFSGENRFLSNFYPAQVTFEGSVYATVEHAYQAAKSPFENDREYVRSLLTPGKAKKAGYTFLLDETWEYRKPMVMFQCLLSKFSHVDLRKKLLETGNRMLVEGNEWGDKYWGCVRENGIWEGQNMLGKFLMFIRSNSGIYYSDVSELSSGPVVDTTPIPGRYGKFPKMENENGR